ncbi:UDP-3-O-acyl-N-acetylglucosamine deacetylase [Rhodobacteraceae bacterium NNCM2]|nr:UDP-3-O-acyl-N-acetylglucosamine deacetylase [Coraliihabitans acroporae]
MHRTISKSVSFEGVGLHGGQKATLVLQPAAAGAGITFIRSDVDAEAAVVPARYDLVNDTRLCTKLSNDEGVSVSTVEHLMAALAGCGVSDVIARIDGPEVPILDGSSLPFVRELNRVGLVETGGRRRAIRILEPVTVESEGRVATLKPCRRTEIAFAIKFDDPAIGEQSYEMVLEGNGFASSLSDCRTFCMLSDVQKLRQIGLARGGGLENAVVVDKGRVLNPEGLRRPDEFVRHKALDAIGDLALAGAPIIGRYEGFLSGHEMTNRLLRALFAQPEAWEWVDADDALLPHLQPPVSLNIAQPITMAV